MLETLYSFTVTNDKKIERIIDEDLAAVNHMVLPQGDRLPPHAANSNVFMIVSRGTISLQLDEQEEHHYPAGSIINIPHRTFMNVVNTHEETVELFVVKVPGPRTMDNK